MRSILLIILVALPVLANAQKKQNYKDSLLTELSNAANDTIRLEINRKLGFYLQNTKPDSALLYHQAQQALGKKLNLMLWELDASQQIAYCYKWLGNLPAAFDYYTQALKKAEDPASAKNGWGYANFSYSKSPEEARLSIIGMIHYELSDLYKLTRFYNESLNQLFEALSIGERLKNQKIISLSTRDIGHYYLQTNKLDSAFLYLKKAELYYKNSPYQANIGSLYSIIGQYYLQNQQYDSAKLYLGNAIDANTKPSAQIALSYSNRELGKLYKTIGQLDSAMVYTFKGVKIAESINANMVRSKGYTQLAAIYRLKNKHSLAYNYLEKGKILSDSLNEIYITRLMQFLNIGFDQKIQLQKLEKESQETKSRIKLYALLVGLTVLLSIALFLYRSNKQKQQANKVLESTLNNLKSTQSQLIQSEKMASLGELTAGIAHEIQNPLNFVNNFSEVSGELVDEMKEEIEGGHMEDVNEIASDLKQNLEKINHHGKRASGIVKSMLEHSRTGDGSKELTDINKLADEYLRLSYHGLRAKDKSFNADFELDLDEKLPKVEVVPQDIGRVLLNLINNAFFAVSERAKNEGGEYKPTVILRTTYKSPLEGGAKGGVEISVTDNGNGIPEQVRDKIFQPFFTTKPTGQGTGLGLSMSYDIITKGHGGELRVESKTGLGSEFIIYLKA